MTPRAMKCRWCACTLRSRWLHCWRLGCCGTCYRRMLLPYAPPPCPRDQHLGRTYREAWRP